MKQLKELRTKHKLTQAEVGKLIGVAQNTISTWESGRTEPNIAMLKSLSKVFKVSIDKLL